MMVEAVVGYIIVRSNRTFMELKYRSKQRRQQHRNGSNRTFMELKSKAGRDFHAKNI